MKSNHVISAALLTGFASVAAAQDQKQDQGWDVNGMSRILVEKGDMSTNMWYPELAIKAKKGSWTIQAIPDVVDTTPDDIGGDYELRAHTLTAAYDVDHMSIKVGVLPPFGRRVTGTEFDSGMMGAYLSDQLTIEGGVIGLQISKALPIGGVGDNIQFHVMGGTKDENFSKFGNPQGPGFNTGIWGAGVELQTNDSLRAGYNHTSFGEGANGLSQDVHYAYAAKHYHLENFDVGILAEVQHSITEMPNSIDRDTHYVGMAQLKGGLAGDFGWRVAGGIADDVPAVEAFATYKSGKFAAQLGAACVQAEGGSETIANMVLKREF